QTTPQVLIYSDDFRETVSQMQADANTHSLRHFVHLEGEGAPGSRPYSAVQQEASPDPIFDPTIEAEDIAALIFTGGTTGLPKAAQVSHRMIAWNTLNTVIHDLHHDDIYLNVFPLFHTGGLFVYTLPNVIMGGTTILLRQFEPERVLQLIEQERVTIFAGVPTMYQLLTQASNWDTAVLTSLRFCTSGGAPLPVPLVQKYTAEKGIHFKQGFGMTEFGPGIFALAAEDAISHAGSIGRPNFFVAARVVDDENRPLGAGDIGELVLKGPSQSSGYFNDPAATAESIDDEGWFHTGDLAVYDEGWYFTIKDRKKDMFITGGENVYPAEIEAVLYGHTAVHQCAVVGIPDAKWGEVGLACVVLQPGASATESELLDYLGQNLARYKVPKTIKIMKALPISNAGKILKRELKQQFS
ncbi:MAG TPA: AMP-binding protein, partial [Chloroflexota bacterium]|nr:AMP-binding protein [Chloroflexota bacterium]